VYLSAITGEKSLNTFSYFYKVYCCDVNGITEISGKFIITHVELAVKSASAGAKAEMSPLISSCFKYRNVMNNKVDI